MPNEFLTNAIAPEARMINTVPPIAANNAVRASFNFPGSPPAIRNSTPVTTQKITTIQVPTINTCPATAWAMLPIVWPKANAGIAKPDTIDATIFLFMCWLYNIILRL